MKRYRDPPAGPIDEPTALPSPPVTPPVLSSTSLLLKPRRARYSAAQKCAVLALLASNGDNHAVALRAINRVSGFEKVRRSHLLRWLRDGVEPRPRSGRPVAAAFESAVLGRLLHAEHDEGDVTRALRVVANVAHSYRVVRLAAAAEQADARWLRATRACVRSIFPTCGCSAFSGARAFAAAA